MSKILRCDSCKSYGLSEQCPCGGKRVIAKTAKYNPSDKYARQRRLAKEQQDVESNNS